MGKKGNHADLLKEALDRHIEELTYSGVNIWLAWKNKFLNALDEVVPMASFQRRNNISVAHG